MHIWTKYHSADINLTMQPWGLMALLLSLKATLWFDRHGMSNLICICQRHLHSLALLKNTSWHLLAHDIYAKNLCRVTAGQWRPELTASSQADIFLATTSSQNSHLALNPILIHQVLGDWCHVQNQTADVNNWFCRSRKMTYTHIATYQTSKIHFSFTSLCWWWCAEQDT